jgi:hypothetical protein
MHHIIELLFTKNKVKIKFSLFSFTNISCTFLLKREKYNDLIKCKCRSVQQLQNNCKEE